MTNAVAREGKSRWWSVREEVLEPTECEDELQPLHLEETHNREQPPTHNREQPPVSDASRIVELLDSTALFVLAKEWVDLLTIYVFRLSPAPFCVGDTTTDCAMKEASGRAQTCFALFLLLVAAGLKQVTLDGHTRDRVKQMLGMAVGWAAGAACVASLRETSHSTLLDFALAVLATMVSGVVIAFLQPWTLSFDPFSDGPCADAFEHVLKDIWQLTSKALAMLVMIVWNHVLSRSLSEGLYASQVGGVLHQKLLLLWAVALTTFLSALTVQAAKLRVRMQRQQQQHEQETMSDRDEAAAEASFLRLLEARVNRRAAAIQLLNLADGSFGWVSGCAWTNAVASLFGSCLFASSSTMQPSMGTTIGNGAIAISFTLGACGWMVATGDDINLDEQERRDRDKVERFFITNGLGFFVGWSWVVVARHLVDLVGRRVLHHGEMACVLVLGPGLTLLLLVATRRVTGASRDGTALDASLGKRIRAQRLRRRVVRAMQSVVHVKPTKEGPTCAHV